MVESYEMSYNPSKRDGSNVKIGLDARTAIGNISGVGNYLIRIIEAGAFSNHTLYAYYDERADGHPPDIDLPEETTLIWRPISTPQFVDRVFGPASPLWWVNITLYRSLRQDNIEAFFGPNFVQPIPFDGPSTIIVHDVIHREYSDAHPTPYCWYLQASLTGSLWKADQVITVSEHSKQDLLKYHEVDPQTIAVASGAAAEQYQPRDLTEQTRERLRKKFDLPDKFLLYVGNIEPRKNITGVLEALSKIRDEDRPPLVIVGKEHVVDEEFSEKYQKCSFQDDIIFTGYVPEEDLPILYNMASVFVFPSFYEGFGLPVLEALQSGTPVVTSDSSSLPEVAGDAAISVNPQANDQIKDAILQLWADHEMRSDYRKRGLQRAQQFSWTQTAARISEVCNQCFLNK